MTCFTNQEDGMEILLDYCSGALNADKAAAVAAHAQGCAECQGLIEAQRGVFASLDEFAAPEVSSDFDQHLYARIAQENREPAWKRWLSMNFTGAGDSSWWKPALAAGFAAAVLAVVLIIPGRQSDSGVSTANQQSRIEHVDMNVDMNQVEQGLEDLDLLEPQTASGPM